MFSQIKNFLQKEIWKVFLLVVHNWIYSNLLHLFGSIWIYSILMYLDLLHTFGSIMNLFNCWIYSNLLHLFGSIPMYSIFFDTFRSSPPIWICLNLFSFLQSICWILHFLALQWKSSFLMNRLYEKLLWRLIQKKNWNFITA